MQNCEQATWCLSTFQQLFSFFCFLLFFLTTSSTTTTKASSLIPCSVCQDGSPIDASRANVSITIPGIPGEYTCSSLETFIPVLFPNSNSSECQLLQSISSLCGCPTAVEEPCQICQSGDIMVYPSRPIDVLAARFGGFSVTCRLLDAYTQTSLPQNDTQCRGLRWLFSEYCGCGMPITPLEENEDESAWNTPQQTTCNLCADRDSQITLPEKELNIVGFPLETCQELSDATSTLFQDGSNQCNLFQRIGSFCGCPVRDDACSMCIRNGGSLIHPDRTLPFLSDDFQGLTPTCQLLESYGHSVKSNTQECSDVMVMGGFCGCPPIDNHCVFCDDGLPEKNEKKVVSSSVIRPIGIDLDYPFTCDIGIAMQYQVHEDEEFCRIARSRQDLCCDGEPTFGRATTQAKKLGYIWVPRMSGLLALIGSTSILQDVLRDKTKRRHTYNQIMAAMSCFDMLYAIAIMFSSAPNDTEDLSPIPGEVGNAVTCKVQGFFIQLGVTSVMYNISLSTYYLLVIVFGWRNDKVKSVVLYLHLAPLLVGLSLSFAGIPFYDSTVFFCHLPTPPLVDSWWPNVFLYFVPVYSAIVFHSIIMLTLYLKVRKQTSITRKWRFRNRYGNAGDENSSSSGHIQQTRPVNAQSRRSFGRTATNGIVTNGTPTNATSTNDRSCNNLDEAPSTENADNESSSVESVRRASAAHRVVRANAARLRARRNRRIEREVAWQAFFYVVAYFISWPIFSIAYTNNFTVTSYWFYIVVLVLAPLQGFFNAIIYYRPRVIRALRKRRRERGSLATSVDDDGDDENENERSAASSGVGTGILRAVKIRFWKKSSTGPMESTSRPRSRNGESEDFHLTVLEPSAMVANLTNSIDEGSSSTHSLVTHNEATTKDSSVYLANIREELEEIERADQLIEPYDTVE